MVQIFISFLYQPFLNILVIIYSYMNQFFGDTDMGAAVIAFTFLIRLLLFPLTVLSTESEKERIEIQHSFEQIVKNYNGEPIRLRQEKNRLIKKHQGTIRFELLNLLIQFFIALILWRIFGRGLKGEDLYLLYSWVPHFPMPIDLMFMDRINLAEPNVTMNVLSAVLLFIVETLTLTFSVLPASHQDRIIQFILPIAAYLYMSSMPAGKALFLITTLSISVVIILTIEISRLLTMMNRKNAPTT
ncbi:hypothetical protein HGA91_00655 [candidate division WWE3 bacterium]|nr:hypothetical protein [candidate division WWE3 bacterium]